MHMDIAHHHIRHDFKYYMRTVWARARERVRANDDSVQIWSTLLVHAYDSINAPLPWSKRSSIPQTHGIIFVLIFRWFVDNSVCFFLRYVVPCTRAHIHYERFSLCIHFLLFDSFGSKCPSSNSKKEEEERRRKTHRAGLLRMKMHKRTIHSD